MSNLAVIEMIVDRVVRHGNESFGSKGWELWSEPSRVSDSIYITVYNEDVMESSDILDDEASWQLKIRVSDHDLPCSYGHASGDSNLYIDVTEETAWGIGSDDWIYIMDWISQKIGHPISNKVVGYKKKRSNKKGE